MDWDEDDFYDPEEEDQFNWGLEEALEEAEKKKGRKLTRRERQIIAEEYEKEWDDDHEVYTHEYNEF